MTDFLFAAFPIAVLIFVMTKPRPLPSTVAFALAAVLAYAIRLFWFGSVPVALNAAVIAGLLEALTPIAILFGAIFFFVAMEKSGAMGILQEWLRGISPNPDRTGHARRLVVHFPHRGCRGLWYPGGSRCARAGRPWVPCAACCGALSCLQCHPHDLRRRGYAGVVWLRGAPAVSGTNSINSAHSLRSCRLSPRAVLPVFALRFIVPWSVIGKNIALHPALRFSQAWCRCFSWRVLTTSFPPLSEESSACRLPSSWRGWALVLRDPRFPW